MLANKDVRFLIKSNKLRHWQIAQEIGIHETSLVRWLREELEEESEREQKIVEAINTLAKKEVV